MNKLLPKADLLSKISGLAGFYLLLLVALTIAAFHVIDISRTNTNEYNRIINNTAGTWRILLNIRQEAAEVQASQVRIIFNTEPEHVEYENRRIDSLHAFYANNWQQCFKLMSERGQVNLFDTLMYYRKLNQLASDKLVAANISGGISNKLAVELYYTIQLPAYYEYQKCLSRISTQLANNVTQQLVETNKVVSQGSFHVKTWLGICFLFMVAGIVIISHYNKRLLQIQQELLKERQNKHEQISRQTLRAQEQERNQIGKELHDNVNQLLTVVKMNLSMVNEKPDKVHELVPRSIEYLQRAIEEIRCLCKSIVSPLSNEITLQDSISELVSTIESSTEKSDFYLHFDQIDEEGIDSEVKVALYRILQEQLNNIIKHAEASNVWIHLSASSDQLELSVKDDGKGFDMKGRRKGIGVNNIINRAEAYKGTAHFTSSPNMGCKLLVLLPFNSKKLVPVRSFYDRLTSKRAIL